MVKKEIKPVKKVKARFKLDRKLKLNILGTKRNAVHFRPYPAGQHGLLKRKEISTFGNILNANRMVRHFYGDMRAKRFNEIVTNAKISRVNIVNKIVESLESFLSSIVYRAKWASTYAQAKQLVSHCHVLVNGKKANIWSERIYPNDQVSLAPKMKGNVNVMKNLENTGSLSPYIEYGENKYTVIFARITSPTLQNTTYPVEMKFETIIGGAK